MNKCIPIFLLILLSVVVVNSQDPVDEVSLKSWRKGTEQVVEKKVNVTVSREEPKFTEKVLGTKGEVFELRIKYRPINSLRRDHWIVQLFELTSNKEAPLANADLFNVVIPGEGGDHFPTDGNIRFLYPETRPYVWFNRTKLMTERQALFLDPLMRTRIFFVAAFKATVRVHSVQLDKEDQNHVRSMELTVEFSNL